MISRADFWSPRAGVAVVVAARIWCRPVGRNRLIPPDSRWSRSPTVTVAHTPTSDLSRESQALPPSDEAVAQTPGELAGSLLRVGSENGHLIIRRAQGLRGDVAAYGSSGRHFLERAAPFQRRLCATASAEGRWVCQGRPETRPSSPAEN